MEIDMNGGIQLNLHNDYALKVDLIWSKVEELDKQRSLEEIYNENQIFYPLKRILIEDEEDDELKVLFDSREYISSFSQQLNSWLLKNNDKGKKTEIKKEGKRPPRLTFYSYKGGVGRSTSLAITARLLAKQGLKVAIIDLDLEAPGINSLLLTKPKSAPFGVVDYLYHAPWIREKLDKKRFVSQYIVREDVPRRNEKAGQLIVMSAGGTNVSISNQQNKNQLSLLFDEEEVEIKLDPNYLSKLSYIDFDVYSRQSSNVFEWLLEDIAEFTEADIILMDARTGISNVSGALINQVSDFLSIHLQDNRQNREGVEFIAKSLSKEKIKNVLWSHTKVPKDPKSTNNLRLFLHEIFEIDQSLEDKINLLTLPFDNNLEDINAHQLKEYIDGERVSLASYKNLTDQICSLTNLNERLSSFLGKKDRETIVSELYKMTNIEFNVPLYISQRFLSSDLEQFIGFPGSGKKTFSNYIKENYDKDIEVFSYEEFINKRESLHRIITHATFLDWNYLEATQAVCKYFLKCNSFYNWLIKNESVMNLVEEKELNAMRDLPEYELPEKVLDLILNFIFSRDRVSFGGFRILFNRLQYRHGFVLPKDLMKGVKLFLSNSIEAKRFNKKEGTESLFRMRTTVDYYKTIWREIGEEKSDWLLNLDKNLLDLIKAYHKIDRKEREFFGIPTVSFAEKVMKNQFQISDDEFKILFEKALDIEIFQKRVIGGNNREELLILSPVYSFIQN